MSGKLVKDWFSRRADDAFTFSDESKKMFSWDRGRTSLSSYLVGDNKSMKEASRIISSMFKVLKVKKTTSFVSKKSSTTAYSSIKLPLHLLQDEGKWIERDLERLDAFYGSAIQNAAKITLDDGIDRDETRKLESGKRTLNKVLGSILNNERIDKKIAGLYPGYLRFVQKYKQYTYDKNYTPCDIFAGPQERLLDLVIRMLRYPAHITESEMYEFAEPIQKIEKMIKRVGGIPDTAKKCNNLGKRVAKIISDYTPPPPPAPPSSGEGEPQEESDSNDAPRNITSSSEPSKSKPEEDNEESEESTDETEEPGTGSEGESEDSEDDEKSSEDTESESTDGGESESNSDADTNDDPSDVESDFEPLSDKELDNLAESIERNSFDQDHEDENEVNENDLKEFTTEMIADEKDKDSGEEDYDFSFAKGVSPHKGIHFEKAPPSKSKYNEVRKKIDFTKARVFRRMFERRAKDHEISLKSMRSGRLDTNKLAEAKQGVPTIYERYGKVTTNKVLVGVLIDESGSMCGKEIEMAQQAAIYINEIFRKMNDVNLFIYGHTADRGGDHIVNMMVYKEPGFNEDPAALGSVQAGSNNRDGDAILASAMRIRRFSKDQGILFVISDGQPAARNYNGAAAIQDTRNKVTKAQDLGFQVIQIAINEHVPSDQMFDYHIKMTSISELPSQLSTYMSTKIDKMIRQKMTM